MIRFLFVLAFVGLGLASAVLTLGAFGWQNPNNPVVFISDIESSVAKSVNFLTDNQYSSSRGFAYMGFSVVFASLAALFAASTKRDSVPNWRKRKVSR